MRARYLLGGIAARIALACLFVSATAILVIAVGVLGFGQSAFQRLMMQHGATAAAAHQMFQQTVTAFFVGAGLLAGSVSLLLAVLLARRLSHPLDQIGEAARRVAEGHYYARVPRGGPEEVASLADSFNQMAESLGEQERIPAADLPYIFERFYRVEKSRDRARGGAGIGLAIVKQLVESGGGRVGVESHTGLTHFWFSLPA